MKPTVIALLMVLAATACSKSAPESEADATTAPAAVAVTAPAAVVPPSDPVVAASSASAFLKQVSALCGKAYAGRVVVDTPKSDDSSFAGKPLVMHVRECGEDQIRIPFHVGDDHSRTWVLTRRDQGLQLKHDHRHEDGRSDAVTLYGGDSAPTDSPVRQTFPVDAASSAMFDRAGLADSMHNTWAMEITPDQRFMYELSRPDGRLFQVEFDLTAPVAEPPPPWGADAVGSPW